MKSRKPFWAEHILRCSNSEISQKEYCSSNELNYNTFKYWQNKLKKENSNSSGFIELPIQSLSGNSEIKITLSNGITISVNPSINPDSVKQYIKSLKEII